MARSTAERARRYRELRELGYSSKEARRLRDTSDDTRKARNRVERRQLQRQPVNLRDEARQERINRLARAELGRERAGTVLSKRERARNWDTWSNVNVGFPEHGLMRVAYYNDRAGLPPDNPFGFRAYYHEYVNGRSDEDNAFLAAERRDSQ